MIILRGGKGVMRDSVLIQSGDTQSQLCNSVSTINPCHPWFFNHPQVPHQVRQYLDTSSSSSKLTSNGHVAAESTPSSPLGDQSYSKNGTRSQWLAIVDLLQGVAPGMAWSPPHDPPLPTLLSLKGIKPHPSHTLNCDKLLMHPYDTRDVWRQAALEAGLIGAGPLKELQRSLRVLVKSIHITTSVHIRIKVTGPDHTTKSRSRLDFTASSSVSLPLPASSSHHCRHPAIASRAMSGATDWSMTGFIILIIILSSQTLKTYSFFSLESGK